MSFKEFIAACDEEAQVNLSQILCVSGEDTLAEYCWDPYRMDTLKLCYSMTKSFSSLAIGIASDLGLLKLDDPIMLYFPEDMPERPHENLKKITIRHLLTMSSGIHENTYGQLFTEDNWIRAFLKQDFPHEPGTYYRYSTHGSHMLSAIITSVSGLSLEDFLNRHLFFPMGITEAQWERSPEGLIAGGMGLSLYPESLAKIAQLLLNRGVYNEKRLISERYLAQATTTQIVKQDDIEKERVYEGVGYGFQFHIGKDRNYRADGAFGQLCLICPERQLAFVVFSQDSNMEKLLALIDRHLMDENWEMPETVRIRSDTAQLTALPEGRYRMGDNLLRIRSVAFRGGEDPAVMLERPDRTDFLRYSTSGQTNGRMHFIKDLQEHEQEYVCFAGENHGLELTVHFIETPYVTVWHFSFGDEGELRMNFSINVSFNLQNFTAEGVKVATTENRF